MNIEWTIFACDEMRTVLARVMVEAGNLEATIHQLMEDAAVRFCEVHSGNVE